MIVDDEAPARARLSDLLDEMGGWEIVAAAANGKEALVLCQDKAPDVVLLDIRMPEMDGLELADHLTRLPVPPAVIFTTAYDEYAVKAFDTHAVAYLLKPVRRERLSKALEHAARLSRMQLQALTRENPELGARSNIPVGLAGGIKLVPLASVVSFHADQKYVRMVYEESGELRESLVDEPLKVLEGEFVSEFVRVHRNSLLRVSAIDSLIRDDFGQYFIHMRIGSAPVPVSRRHVAALKQRLR